MRKFLKKLVNFIKSLFSFDTIDETHDNVLTIEENPHVLHIQDSKVEIKKEIDEFEDYFEEDIEELEAQGGQCCSCCHFCKHDPDDISGYCDYRCKDMLEDDGCIEYEESEDYN